MFLLSAAASSHQMTAWDQLVAIISKSDNMPVAGALLLVFFFPWAATRHALRNDKLIREGREDEILEVMQK